MHLHEFRLIISVIQLLCFMDRKSPLMGNTAHIVVSVFDFSKTKPGRQNVSHLLVGLVFAELEKRFKSNEQRMQMQRTELDKLKENATLVRDEIRDQVQKYSNCQ